MAVAAPRRARAGLLRAGGSWITSAAVAGPAAILAIGAWRRRWMAEDGFITLRVVQHLLDGHGPVFNVGERVEASTSPLWTILLGGVRIVVPVRLEVLAIVLGLAGAVTGMALGSLAAYRLWAGRPGDPRAPRGNAGSAVVPLGAFVIVALPPFRDFVTSGLETGLAFGWLGASAFALAREAERPPERLRGPAVACLVGLGPLVRPDLAVLALPLLGALIWLRAEGVVAGRLRRAAGVLTAGLALPAAWQVFRMGYYAALVPNTALAKEGTEAWWSQGWRYLGDLARPYQLWIPIAAGAVVLLARFHRSGPSDSDRRRAVVLLAAPAGAVLHGLYVVRVGGDFMHGRLLLPTLFALCLPVMVVAPRRPWEWAGAGVVATWAAAVVLTGAGPTGSHGIVDERAFWVGSAGRVHPVLAEDYRAHGHFADGNVARLRLQRGGAGLALRPDPRLGDYAFVPFRPGEPLRVGIEHANVGIVGAAAGTGVRVVDIMGRTDPVAARLRLHTRVRPGHEKHLGRAWIWAREVAEGTPGFDTGPAPDAVDDARRALRCGALGRLGPATTGQLTPARFVANLVDAVRLHRLRVDPDPAVARSQICR